MPGLDCLLVKTASEIYLKSDFVRRFFTKKLVESMKFALKRNGVAFSAIERGGGRLYVFCENPKKAQDVLSTISGIHATAIARRFRPAEYALLEKQIVSFAKGLLKKGDSFALDARVANNKAFSAKELENRLGAAVMKAIPGLKVNLSNPEKEIFIEVGPKSFFVFSSEPRGLGGLPLGVEGSVAMFFSGKKEELAAAFLLMHRGCSIFPVVKKKSGALEMHLQWLVPFNGYREFVFTEKNYLPALVEGRNIKAIATADSKLDEKSLASYKKFDALQSLVVLRPLLLYPKEAGAGLKGLFAKEKLNKGLGLF
ncbi:MAG: THUMP domain-containing protein [archaeon]